MLPFKVLGKRIKKIVLIKNFNAMLGHLLLEGGQWMLFGQLSTLNVDQSSLQQLKQFAQFIFFGNIMISSCP